MGILVSILEWTGVTLSSSLLIPQMLKLFLNAKLSFSGGKIQFTKLPEEPIVLSVPSYAIFILGQILWTFFYSSFVNDMYGAYVANIVNSVATLSIFYFVAYKTKDKNTWILAGVSTALVLGVTITSILGFSNILIISFTGQDFVIPIMAGACTSLAFLPQTIKELKATENSSQSIFVFYINALANMVWILYFIFFSIHTGTPYVSYAAATSWSSLAIVIMLTNIVSYTLRNKRKPQVNEEIVKTSDSIKVE